MATVSDHQRQSVYNRQAYGYHGNVNTYNPQFSNRSHAGSGYGMQHPTADMNALAHGFSGMNLPAGPYGGHTGHTVAGAAAGRLGANNNLHSVYGAAAAAAAASYGYPSPYPTGTAVQGTGEYSAHSSHYMPHVGYQGYQTHENSPLSQNWTPTTTTGGDLPTLVTPRRDSVSSNENDQPATPSYANYASLHGGVAINRSPSGVFTHSTPSPTSMMGSYAMHMAKQPEQSDISPRLKLLVAQDPAIPRAIPAPSSPLKPLDRALENQRGETNVYIRGLLPETTDEMLESWGSRFGDIKSSKSIIDMPTGLCKGFGFVKYHNYEDAENCIRGFHYLGYEVSFARESFYSKLKTFSDEANTNLYVSNLPKSMNEHELANLFEPHKVCSARILRDKNGHGRGVGFARFEDRDACEEVINAFNNHTISGSEDLQIQIRYADTQEQKALKQQTQAARQFRSAEYEYATQAWRHARVPYNVASSDDGNKSASNTTTNEFEQYLGGSNGASTTTTTTSATATNATSTTQSSRWPHTLARGLPGRSPLASTPYTNSTAQPSAGGVKADGQATSANKATKPDSATATTEAERANGDSKSVKSPSNNTDE